MEAHPRVAGLEDPGSAQLLHIRGVDLAQRAVPPRRVHRAMVGAPVLIGAVLDLIRRGTSQRGGGRQQGGQGKKHHHLRQFERVVVTPVCHRVLRPVVGESTWFQPSTRGTEGLLRHGPRQRSASPPTTRTGRITAPSHPYHSLLLPRLAKRRNPTPTSEA